MRLPVAQVLAACLRSARFQRFQQYLQGTCHIRSADLRKIFQHRRCCGRISNQPFAQSRRVFRDMPEHVLRSAGTACHQRRQQNRGRWRLDQRFRSWLGLVWRCFAPAVRLMPAMRRAHIRHPYGSYGLRNPYGSRVRNLCRQSQECNSVPAERCEYASHLP